MKQLRQIFTTVLTLTTGLVVSAKNAFAQPAPSGGFQNNGALGEVKQADLDALNPLIQFNDDPALAEQLSKPGGILTRVLTFAFPLAGVILLVMILWGGFEMISGAANKKSMDAGRQRITSAIIGFVILFVSYWLIRVVELVFGLQIVTF